MNTKTKNYRKPSAQRKIGAYALQNYALGGFVALLYIVFVSVPMLSNYFEEVTIIETKDIKKEDSGRFLTPYYQERIKKHGKIDYEKEWRSQDWKGTYWEDKWEKELERKKKVNTEIQAIIDNINAPLIKKQHEALRVTSLSGAMIILIIYLLSGHKYGFIKNPRFIPRRFYLFSLPFFAVYFYFLTVDNVSYLPSFWVVFLTLIPPFLLFTSFNIYMGVAEYIKETNWYVETFVTGKGGSARWGGLLSYIKYDFTQFMKGEERKEGGIYCGRTKWQYDLKIGGRDIGLNTDSMMLTVAKMGGGKSYYMAWNELLSWQGGAFIFDPKGEHTERTYPVRSATAPFYTLDPLKGIDPRAKIPLSCYNPLDDIDLDSSSASAELLQIMQAGIYEEKNEGANSKYFRDKAVEIGLGYLVQLLTSYDKKFHNLPCFYNLFLMGSPDGVGIDEGAKKVLLAKMSVNEAVGKAAMNAAQTLLDAGEKGELGGIKNSFSNGFNWVNEDSLKPLLMKSDFSMKEIRKKDATVSVVIHMNHIDDPRLIKWLRVLIAMGLQASKVPTTSGLKSLFMLDEFAQLGTFNPIKKGLVKLRDQNVKIHMFLQDLGQLKDNYTNYTEFMSSSDKQFFAVNDEYTAEKISSLLGEYREEHFTGVEDKGLHYSEKNKNLRTKDEILKELREGSGVQYIFPSEGNPMLLKLVPFTKNFKKYGKVYRNKFG